MAEKSSIRSCETVNDRAAERVTATCEGANAGAVMAWLANELQKENRRRRHRGDSPIAYEIHSAPDTTSISS